MFIFPLSGERAEWHLDNVMVMANESAPLTLSDDMDGNRSTYNPWFSVSGATVTPGCGSDEVDGGNVMLFSGPGE